MSNPASAATDVAEFIFDLDGGQFARLLSAALSEVGIGVMDAEKKKGKVSLDFDYEKIAGTHQVRITHTIKFTRPTEDGKKTEEITRNTPMYVGKFGALSLVPETQAAMFDRQGQPVTGAATKG